MGNFEFIFHTEPDDKIYEWIKDSDIDYYFWCFLDIKIDGVPFFNNFSSESYVKEESDEEGFREC